MSTLSAEATTPVLSGSHGGPAHRAGCRRPRFWGVPLERAYKTFGYGGMALGTALALGLTVARGRSVAVTAGAVALGYGVSYALTLATKVARGGEQLVFFHYLLAVGGCAALVPWVVGARVLPYLEAVVLGLGLMQACGRLGCFAVGCCHGRPARRGVRYGEAHARAGLAPHLVGVPLVPVQLLEASWSAAVVALATALILRGALPGSALLVYLLGYGGGRFALELLRGDPGRPRYLGLSEAQWTSLALAAGALAAGAGGLVPGAPWATAAAGSLLAAGAILAVASRGGRSWRSRLLDPRHVGEIARSLERLLAAEGGATGEGVTPIGDGGAVRLERTGEALQVSTGLLRRGGTVVRQYSFSGSRQPLSPRVARAVARLILRLRHPGRTGRLVAGGSWVFHLLVEGRRVRPALRQPAPPVMTARPARSPFPVPGLRSPP